MPVLLLLLVVFIVVPLAELFVIIQVGQAIGVLPTLAILLLDSILGSLLLRSQGRDAWRRLNEAIAEGRAPAREVLDGGLIIFGGAFLLTPGFLTDIVGILLLLPPTRAVVRGLLVRTIFRGFVKRAAMRFAGAAGGAAYRRTRARRGPAEGYDVEGSAVEVDPAHQLRP